VRAAVVAELGRPPDVVERADPVVREGEAVVEILAAALNPLDVNVGAGRFYGGHPPLPYVPGAEGVGRLGDRQVWVFGGGIGTNRDGTFAERVAAPTDALLSVPDGADPAVAAALGIGGVSGWLPLVWRAPVRTGETVLVLGATGAVGLIAVQAAKLLGARSVIAVGRKRDRLERAEQLGAERSVVLDEAFGDALQDACPDGIDLIFDPLWGEPLATALGVAKPRARILHMGQSAGPTSILPSGTVRGRELEILGYSTFTAPRDVLEREYGRLVEHVSAGRIVIDVERVPLTDTAAAWERQARGAATKIVLLP
jgi:NADPH:quinone reductase-like Zn-dependent oxidoreductase